MKPRLATILFVLTASATLALAADGLAQPLPPPVLSQPGAMQPGQMLRPADQDFLLQMRRSMGSEAPKWAAGTPEQQEQWFREGLEQAAHNTPAEPPRADAQRPSLPFRLGPASQLPAGPHAAAPESRGPAQREHEPEPWQRLLGASQQLTHIAHDLDHHGFWAESDTVRAAAAELREQARRLSGDGSPSSPPGPHEGPHTGHDAGDHSAHGEAEAH